MEFIFSDKLHKKAQNLALATAIVSLLFLFGIEREFGFHWSLILLMAPSLILVATTDTHRRENYRHIVGSSLTISDKSIKYTQPINGYSFEKFFTDIERSKLFHILGCPVLSIDFKNNETIKIVALENSLLAHEKVSAMIS